MQTKRMPGAMKNAVRGKIRPTRDEDVSKARIVNAIVNGEKTQISVFDTPGQGSEIDQNHGFEAVARMVHLQVGGDPERIKKMLKVVGDFTKDQETFDVHAFFMEIPRWRRKA